MPNKKYKASRGKTLTSRQKKVMDLQDTNLSNEDILNKMQNKGMTQKEGKIKKTSGINMGTKISPKTAKAMYKAAIQGNKDKIAQETYGEFGFDTLKYSEQQEVYKNYPKLPRSSKDIGSDFETPAKMEGSPLYGKISSACKAAAKKKFKVWPSAYASGWGVRCTKAGGPGKFGGKKKK